MSALWGIPYLFIKVAVDDGLSPAFVAWSRVVLAAIVLLALAKHAGVLGELGGKGRWLAAYALLEISIPFPLIAAGERHIDSSVAAIIIASVPLMIAVLAIRFDRAERATGSRLVGLLVGFTGVVVLVGIDVAGRGDEMLGAAFVLIASMGYAVGPMILRRHLSDLDQRGVMAVALAIAALFLTPFAAASPPTTTPDADATLSIVVLGLFCTAAAFVVFGRLIAEIGPGRALVITYVNPVVALALGMAVLGEHPGAGAIAGLLLILAGSWLSTDGRLPPGLAGFVNRARRTPRRSPATQDSTANPGSQPSPAESPAGSA
jgi:drug/metabolite transporter (DMT)-like permease